MKQTKVTYFDNSEYPTYEDYLEYCRDNGFEPKGKDSEGYYNWANDTLSMEWDDLMVNLKYSKDNNQLSLIQGSVGTWRGRFEITPVLMDTLKDAVIKCIGSCDYAEVTQEDGIVYVSAYHHDGRNSFTIQPLSKKGMKALENYCHGNTIDKDIKDYYLKKYKNYII